MLNTELKNHLSLRLESEILSCKPVSGGDISSAYFIKTKSKNYFLKINTNAFANIMFACEKVGLEAIAKTNTLATPKVYLQENYKQYAYIIMEHIEATTPTNTDFEKLGIQLAKLHQTKGKEFGFSQNNFIGSLHQSNSFHNNWLNFYIGERLTPQLNLALSKKLLNKKEVPNNTQMHCAIDRFFNNITPSLLHGDLWSGNYIISSTGKPYLIDPACYYGHSEVDIAMSKLFGGFNSNFYNAYYKIIPKDDNTNTRIDLYQLYYLLVHLNLFGNSYYSSVKRILSKYF